MNDDDWGRLARVMAMVADSPTFIGTPPDFVIEKLIADTEKLAQESELKLLLIDSLQWMTDHEASSGMSVEYILRRLKRLAETAKIPIIVAAHAERQQEDVPTANPIALLSHSDAIERVADIVMIIDRPDQNEQESPRAGEADLIVAKNRNGPMATVTVAHQGYYCRFVGMMMVGGYDEYPMFPPEPRKPKKLAIASANSQQESIHDRQLYAKLLDQLPSDGEIIDWLKNNFVLKYFPVKYLDAVAQVAKVMSLEVVGFDDIEANDRYNDLRQAIDNFHDKILYYTLTDQSGKRLEVPAEWRNREDRTQYNTAMSTIKEVRNAFVEAYDSFLQTCHKKAIDRDGSPEQ